MKSFTAMLPLVGAALATTYHNETVVWTTTTVQHLTTYCPEATTLTYGTITYTATAQETVTITDCGCEVSHPVTPTHVPHPPTVSSHPPVVTTTKETHVPVTTHVPSIPSTKVPHGNTTTSTTTKIAPPVSVTITVSEYTTYCPYPTTIPVGPGSTITVTEATSLTITACPCTLTKPGVVTTTTTAFTTYCPEATTITIGTVTHTLPAGTVTIPVEHTTTVPAPETTVHAPPPAETHPAPPAETHPAPPAETHPAPPAETHPAPPAETHPAPPAETHPAPPVESETCVERCNAAYNVCRTAPNASRPQCASQYADCLGYVPFNDEGSLVTPTACSTTAAVTQPIPTTVETQVVPTSPAPTQPVITSAPAPIGTGVSSYLPVASTTSLLEANSAVRRDTGLGAVFLAGIVAVMF